MTSDAELTQLKIISANLLDKLAKHLTDNVSQTEYVIDEIIALATLIHYPASNSVSQNPETWKALKATIQQKNARAQAEAQAWDDWRDSIARSIPL